MSVVTVLVVGGTGEARADDDAGTVRGMLAHVVGELDHRFRGVWVPYPASYGPVPERDGVSYRTSVHAGVTALHASMAAARGPVILLGYSQGAVVVREFLGTLSATRSPDGPVSWGQSHLIGAGFVADPHQPVGVVSGCDGAGIAGPGPEVPVGLPTLWIAHRDDMICNASRDSLLRDVADLTGWLSLADLGGWLCEMWNTLRRNSFQNAARTSVTPAQWWRDLRRVRIAVCEVLGYLPAFLMWAGLHIRNPRGGRHTSYATEPIDPGSGLTGCQVLAQWMQVQATFAVGPAGAGHAA
ncbi:PE-PPE domain-containing protein [Gordonia jinhuaensis]|uniref:PE-PPE domain-containing protein n=1 Tax=Gordonia jinhuaensis TaxID=1517702 RepID=UPI00166B510E|nr:PE-PPE domain-containing protein [Gordonia jinhuaensis]